MIPKVIHYCWFGSGKKPKLMEKCIKSWKKHLPDYEIIEWNESNYDFSSAPIFVRQAAQAKKWAFASDYIRYQVVYKYGGFYFDTDVEVLRDLEFLRSNKAFFGIQYNNLLASGLGFGAEKGTPLLLELMKNYESRPFLLPNGYDNRPCPNRDTPVFVNHGFQLNGKEQMLDEGIHIYPTEYFCPCGLYDTTLNLTKNSATIHWFTGSWLSLKQRWLIQVKKLFGLQFYVHIRTLLKGDS